MTEQLILQANVAVATVYENQARGSGRVFWNVVTDAKDRFTAFSRELVARFIDGQQPKTIKGRDGAPDSLAFNFDPPLNSVVYFEVTPAEGGFAPAKVLVPAPAGTVEVPVTQAPSPAQAPAAGPATATPLPVPKPPYKPYGGGQKSGSGWKPEDKRPGLVTMNEAYAKDIVVAIIGNSDDLKAQAPEAVIKWAAEETVYLAKLLLNNTLAELKLLGFDPKEVK